MPFRVFLVQFPFMSSKKPRARKPATYCCVQEDCQEDVLRITIFYFLLQGPFSKVLRRHKDGFFLGSGEEMPSDYRF